MYVAAKKESLKEGEEKEGEKRKVKRKKMEQSNDGLRRLGRLGIDIVRSH